LIKISRKAFTVIEFLIASTLTVAVVGSSTIGMAIAENIQRNTYYVDTMNQVGNSIIQGSKALNCNVIFNSDTTAACKSSFDLASGEIKEINSINDGILFPRTDGLYKYTISRNFVLNIRVSTTWLEATKSDSCFNSNFTVNPSEHPQPNMLLRNYKIDATASGVIVKSKTFTDLQNISSDVVSFGTPNLKTYSVGFRDNTPGLDKNPKLYSATIRLASGETNIVNRYTDWKGCVWFPFIGSSSSINMTNPSYSNSGSTGGRNEA
jgi:hypothetical protein